jgi:hypothetical protein
MLRVAIAFDLAVSVAALGAARARALQSSSDPLGLAGVLGGGPVPAPLSPLQRAVLQAVVALSAGLQLPERNAAGATPESVFGAQMRPWLAQLGGPAVDASAVQLLLNGAAYYNLNGTDMRALGAAVAAVPSAAPAAGAASGASGGGGGLPVAAVAGGAAAVVCAAAAAALLLVRRQQRARARASVGAAKPPRAAAGGKERGAADLASNPLHMRSARAAAAGFGGGRVVAMSQRSLALLAGGGSDNDGGGGGGGGDGAMRLASQAAAHISSPQGVLLQQPLRTAMGPKQAGAGGIGGNVVFAERARAMVMQASARDYGAGAAPAPTRDAATGGGATSDDGSRSVMPYQ